MTCDNSIIIVLGMVFNFNFLLYDINHVCAYLKLPTTERINNFEKNLKKQPNT